MHALFVFLCFSLLPFFSVVGVVFVFVPPVFLCALGLGPFTGILTAVLPAVMDAMSMALLASPLLSFCPRSSVPVVRRLPAWPPLPLAPRPLSARPRLASPAWPRPCPSSSSLPAWPSPPLPPPPPVCPSLPCLASLSALCSVVVVAVVFFKFGFAGLL